MTSIRETALSPEPEDEIPIDKEHSWAYRDRSKDKPKADKYNTYEESEQLGLTYENDKENNPDNYPEVKITILSSRLGSYADYTHAEYNEEKALAKARKIARKELDKIIPNLEENYTPFIRTEDNYDDIEIIYTLIPNKL